MSKERLNEITEQQRNINTSGEVVLANGMTLRQVVEDPDLAYMLRPPQELIDKYDSDSKPKSTADKMRALVQKKKKNGK